MVLPLGINCKFYAAKPRGGRDIEMEAVAERRPGRRPSQLKEWRANLILEERHREALETMADPRGISISAATRAVLDLDLAEEKAL